MLLGTVILTAASTVVAGGAGAVSGNAAGLPGGRVRLAGSVPALPVGAQVVGPSSPTTEVQADVSLQPRDPAALAAFATAVSTPGSPQYHQYLAPGAFATAFGPTTQTVAATRQWLASAGLQVGPTSANRLLIPVSGSVATMEQAFAVPLVQTRLRSGGGPDPDGEPGGPGGSRRRHRRRDRTQHGRPGPSPDRARAHHAHHRSHRWGGGAPAGHPVGPGLGHRPRRPDRLCRGRVPQRLRRLDGEPTGFGVRLLDLYGQGRTAAGTAAAVYELEPYTPSDIIAYESCYGLSVPVSQVSVDGGASGGQEGEAALDIEAVAGLAPASSILVYSGPNDGGTGPIDTYTRMVDDDSARVLSTSWGQCEGTGGIDPTEQSAETTLFQQAAIQGQTVFAACRGLRLDRLLRPARLLELQVFRRRPGRPARCHRHRWVLVGQCRHSSGRVGGWNNGSGGAGGGGVSQDFAARPVADRPGRGQQRHRGYLRCGPQPAVPGSPGCVGVGESQPRRCHLLPGPVVPVGGTSAAAPLWAALAAVENQGCNAAAGLINSALYTAGSAGTPPFNDITSGNNDMFAPPPSWAPTRPPPTTTWPAAGVPRSVALCSRCSRGRPPAVRPHRAQQRLRSCRRRADRGHRRTGSAPTPSRTVRGTGGPVPPTPPRR